MKPKAAIFDMDDTLFDCTGSLVEPARRRAAEVLAKATGSGTEELLREMEEAYKANGPEFDAIGEAARKHGLGEEAVRAAKEAYNAESVEEIRPFADAYSTLEWLYEKDVFMLLVTSGNAARQRAKLAKLRVGHAFDEVNFIDAEADKKAIFAGILSRWKFEPAEVLCVGDRIGSEIRAANELGMVSVRMLRGRFSVQEPRTPEERPRYTIRSLSELKGVVESVEQEEAGACVCPPPRLSEEMELVQRLAEKIVTSPDVDEVLRSIIEGSTELLRAERGSIMTFDEASKELRIRASKGIAKEVADQVRIKLGQSISGFVANTGKAVVIRDIERDSMFARRNREGYMTRSAICVPMKVKGRLIGVMNMSDRQRGEAFSEGDLPLATVIANQAAIALENAELFRHYLEAERLRRELELAAAIQRSFLPSKAPEMEGLDVAAINIPCLQIGGDYYDFFRLPEGGLAVTIGDVSGHGIGSALLMAALRSALHACPRTGLELSDVLAGLNSFLMEDKRNDSFVSIFMGKYFPAGRRFVYSNAGHDYPIRYCASSGEFEYLESTSLPLGIFQDVEFSEGPELKLEKGDVLVLYTDGLVGVGIEEGIPFGRKRVEEAMRQSHDGSADQILNAVLESARAHCSVDYCDDITLIVMKIGE